MNFDVMIDINTRIDTAYTLLEEFFDEYFISSDCEHLIFDAKKRHEVLVAKIFAISDLLRHAKNDIDALRSMKGGEEE